MYCTSYSSVRLIIFCRAYISLALDETNDKKSKRAECIILSILLCLSLIILLLLFPQVAHEGADLGVSLFMDALFPYLLPYLILTNWLIRLTAQPTGKSSFSLFFKTYCISAVGGFPTGAATIAHLTRQGELQKKQAAYLLGICHSPSPLFMFGFVGMDLFGSTTFSWNYLLLLHSFSLIFLVIIYLLIPATRTTVYEHVVDPQPFTNSIKDSIPTVLIVASTIVFFTTIYTVFLYSTDVLFQSLPQVFELFVAGALEMTNGLFLVHQHLDGSMLAVITVLFLTTQSLSIHLQVIVIARGAGIALRPYIWIRLLYSILMPCLYLLFFL